MRIFSDFHDYYDSITGYGFDPNIIYNRRRIIYRDNDEPLDTLLDNSGKNYNTFRYYFFISNFRSNSLLKKFQRFVVYNKQLISFCGEKYMSLNCGYSDDNLTLKYINIYTEDEFEKYINQFLTKKELKKLTVRKNKREYPSIDLYKSFFNGELHKFVGYDAAIELHRKYESPILFESSHPLFRFVVNPILKDLDFQKIKDPFNAFQEISLFLGNLIGKKGNETLEISDKIRSEMHGFDEHSFRKPPTKKK